MIKELKFHDHVLNLMDLNRKDSYKNYQYIDKLRQKYNYQID